MKREKEADLATKSNLTELRNLQSEKIEVMKKLKQQYETIQSVVQEEELNKEEDMFLRQEMTKLRLQNEKYA